MPNAAKPAKPDPKTNPPVRVEVFTQNASQAVGVAGLLASRPDLEATEMSLPEWQAALDDYLSSPRP